MSSTETVASMWTTSRANSIYKFASTIWIRHQVKINLVSQFNDSLIQILFKGDMRPGKSGISLTQNEWKQLLALQADIKFN